MNNPQKPKFTIKAKFIGPIIELDAELSEKPQNLIYARNGTGKTFLSRAFNVFDKYSQNKLETIDPNMLVSEEAGDSGGSIVITDGTNELGKADIKKNPAEISVGVGDAIFHVFSDDFIEHELTQRDFDLDNNIEGEIIVGSDNIDLTEAKEKHEKITKQLDEKNRELSDELNEKKNSELIQKAGVRQSLSQYRDLTFESVITEHPEKPEMPKKGFQTFLEELDKLKSIPSEVTLPPKLSDLDFSEIDRPSLGKDLAEITSPSSVSEVVKDKIEKHHDFFKSGTSIVSEEHLSACPFCEQSISAGSPKDLIDQFIQYFNDAEEQHKEKLRTHLRSIRSGLEQVRSLRSQHENQILKFDKLKNFLPSQKSITLKSFEDQLNTLETFFTDLEQQVIAKGKDLTVASMPVDTKPMELSRQVNDYIQENRDLISDLESSFDKVEDERRSLQRDACTTYSTEFTSNNWNKVEEIHQLQKTESELNDEIKKIESAGPTTAKRERVAKTFKTLLLQVFADKYTLDEEKFVLKRSGNTMTRGAHKTLSEGEKSAIAFCYFIALIHSKVESDTDYQKVFLIFDDPVTSMSYDFVFSIAQVLKCLGVSNQGEISLNPGKVDGNIVKRPGLIILTHSSYFYNICRTNLVIKENASFALEKNNPRHTLSCLKKFIAPFEDQLRHVYRVSLGDIEPDRSTGNSIRSILEAIGRFCRPDKSEKLADFISFVISEDKLTIQSALINNLSHGSYYEETPSPEDIKRACEETIKVVEKYATGQIEQIKSQLS